MQEAEGGTDSYMPSEMNRRADPSNAVEMMRPTSGAAPHTQMVIKGGTIKLDSMAEKFKQDGNSYFTSLEYEKAVESYSKSITHAENDQMKKLVLSNRA